MKFFALNLLLAIVWMFLTGGFDVLGFLMGASVGFLILWASHPILHCRGYVRGVFGTARLLGVFFREMVIANVQLARDILRIRPRLKPGFIAYDARGLSPGQTVVLANMISLTPGTLTVDTDADAGTLYIHTIYAQDPDRLRRGFDLFSGLIHGAWGEAYRTPEVTS